jgi:hypothetical protein
MCVLLLLLLLVFNHPVMHCAYLGLQLYVWRLQAVLLLQVVHVGVCCCVGVRGHQRALEATVAGEVLALQQQQQQQQLKHIEAA